MSVVSMPRANKPLGMTFSSPLPSPTVSSEVENIFVQNPSEEVRKVEEKLRFDIERKKDHLRGIVGERYRDLIDSADLITKLSQTSRQILSEVSSLKIRLGDVSQSLNTESATGQEMPDQVSNETYSRLLLILPEEIYNSLDVCQPVDAALLCLLAGDICAHLQLSNHSSIVDRTQAQVRLGRCRASLSATCRNRLGALTTPIKPGNNAVSELNNKAIGWLTAFVAVDYLNPLDSYEGFLKCRLEMLQSTVTQNNSPNAVSCAIHSYLSTAILTTQLFVENRGTVFATIEQRVAKICPPALSFEEEFVRYTLPSSIHSQLNKIVQHLVQSCQLNNAESLDSSLVYDRLTQWLNSTGQFLASEISKMLEKVPNLEALQTVCEDIGNVLTACCCQNHVPSVGEIWNGFLANAVVNRFETLIRGHFDCLKTDLLELLVNQSKYNPPAIWSSAKASAFSMPMRQSRLEPSQYGRSSSDLFVVGHFTGQHNATGLQSVMSSLDSLWALCREFIASGLPLDSRETCLAKIRQEASSFCNGMIEICQKQLAEEKSLASLPERFLNLSSFSFAMTFLFNYIEDWLSNPNLLVASKAVLPSKSLMSDPVFWSNCRNQISVISVEAFHSAIDSYISKEINERFMTSLETSLNCDDKLKSKSHHEMTWLSVEVEEESDTGQKVISKISVPQQPSLNVYSFISSLCRFSSQSPSFLLKQNNLNITIFSAIIQVYNNFISLVKANEPKDDSAEPVVHPIAQDFAVQHLFDFQLLVALFIGDHRRNQQFASTCIDIIHALESSIDPFDLNTFQPHLAESVRKYVKSVQSIFGLVLSPESANYRGGKTAPPSSSQNDDHNVLRLNQHQGRLTALSIPFSQAQLYPV